MVLATHHVGIAVADLDAAVETYSRLLGAEVEHRDRLEEQGVDAVSLRAGTGRIELLAPLGAETPVGRFLAKRGPGLHHVAYQVPDAEAALDALRAQGVALLDETPRTGIRSSRVAFVHPKSSGGVLTEIVQPAEGH